MILEGLNTQQRTAVTTDAQYVLVLAGAGSGKTRVLTSRMAWLIQQGIARASEIMAVTFTNKAAKEMLTRISAQMPINPRSIWVGTFHGLCNRLLRVHYREVSLPQSFQILDMADQLSAIKRLLKHQSIDTEQFPPKDLQRFINGYKEHGLRPNDVHINSAREQCVVTLYHAYQEQCQREGVVDFAELLLRSYELLKNNHLIREHYQHRFSHVLVDEFQDTNDLQFKWLQLLVGQKNSFFAVGDDDQSIYAFRGANVHNMRIFERDYARKNVIRLEQNYRSYNNILNSANALIQNNTERLGKNLWTDRGDGQLVRVIELSDDRKEAQWLVDEVKSLTNEGMEHSEIAVLYRSNAQSRVIEHAFFSAGLPYRVYGGLRFFERQEVKHVLAYLRLILNDEDDTAFLRVVNFPARGIGARSLENLQDAAAKIGCGLSMAVGALSGTPGIKLQNFIQLIRQMREQGANLELPALVQLVIEQSGIFEFYKQDREGEERLDNLSELVSASQVFIAEESFQGIEALQEITRATSDDPIFADTISPLAMFLAHASLEAGDNQSKHNEEAIQMMTVHAAKGLEFDAVFVSGLEDELFPHMNSLATDDGLEEERRLMYVAITRAKQRLYLSGAHQRMMYGRNHYTKRSRFLEEIPDQFLKWLSPKVSTSYDLGYIRQSEPVDVTPITKKGTSNAGLTGGILVGEQFYRVGQSVRHPKFGEGMVINLSGSGGQSQAKIMFKQAGLKTLALTVAKLEILHG